MQARLFRIAGIDVQADWSLLVIFFLIAVSLAIGLFPAWQPDWSPAMAWTMAVVAAAGFFGSVLVHELAHAFVGRRRGVRIRRITLFIFGGMAHIEREPGQWRTELWMAAAGPLTSLVLGAGCLLVAGLFVDEARLAARGPEAALGGLGALPTLLLWLGQVNIVLALFNLVPGFPLDGGRVLRAILWGATGNLRRATRWAATAGQVFAGLLIAAGLLTLLGVRFPVLGGGPVGGLWLAFIGWFLYSAAQMSYRQLLTRESLEGLPVRRLMSQRFVPVGATISVHTLVENHLLRSGERSFPVVEEGRLAGMVCLDDVKKVAPAERESVAVETIMTPLERLRTLPPDADAYEALATMGELRLNQLPVVQDGRLLGVLRREDLLNWLALRESPSRGAPVPASS